MVSTSLDVASGALGTDRDSDAHGTKRQEDRRGSLAVKRGPPTRGSGEVADRLRPLQVDACGLPGRWPPLDYRPDPPRVEGHSAPHPLFVAGRLLAPSREAGGSSPRNPPQQTHYRRLGGPLGVRRLSSPRWEPEGEASLAMDTDDPMKCGYTEGDVSTRVITVGRERPGSGASAPVMFPRGTPHAFGRIRCPAGDGNVRSCGQTCRAPHRNLFRA